MFVSKSPVDCKNFHLPTKLLRERKGGVAIAVKGSRQSDEKQRNVVSRKMLFQDSRSKTLRKFLLLYAIALGLDSIVFNILFGAKWFLNN